MFYCNIFEQTSVPALGVFRSKIQRTCSLVTLPTKAHGHDTTDMVMVVAVIQNERPIQEAYKIWSLAKEPQHVANFWEVFGRMAHCRNGESDRVFTMLIKHIIIHTLLTGKTRRA